MTAKIQLFEHTSYVHIFFVNGKVPSKVKKKRITKRQKKKQTLTHVFTQIGKVKTVKLVLEKKTLRT
jgi:hypothetical protein